MAARAIASGTISFGMVTVPIKLYTGQQAKNLSFNLLHSKDKSRLRQQYVCNACGEVVDRADMVRGYEYAKDQYAVLNPEEIKALEQQTDQSIEIEEFVPIASIDPIYFEKTYLLGPDKGGQKAYRLLREAMGRAGKGAVAKFSTRGRQQLVLLREARDGLMMHALYYADEVRDFSDIDRGESVTLKPGELELAVQLMGQLGAEGFDAAQAPKGQIIDLMEALKASLASRQPKATAAAETPTAAARKPARAKVREAAAPAKQARKAK
jgi:DNA end-binding protein Ku